MSKGWKIMRCPFCRCLQKKMRRRVFLRAPFWLLLVGPLVAGIFLLDGALRLLPAAAALFFAAMWVHQAFLTVGQTKAQMLKTLTALGGGGTIPQSGERSADGSGADGASDSRG